MNENQSEPQSLDLTKFARSIFEGNYEYDLLKNPNEEKHFEPIPNQFYGFCIPVDPFGFNGVMSDEIRFEINPTIDVDFEDVTHKRLQA